MPDPVVSRLDPGARAAVNRYRLVVARLASAPTEPEVRRRASSLLADGADPVEVVDGLIGWLYNVHLRDAA